MMPNKQKKPAAKPEGGKYPRKFVPCQDGKTEEERGRNYAALMTSPELAAYRVINGAEQKFDMEKHVDVPTLIEQFRDQAQAVNRGDLTQAEAMLMNQATALQSLFARLSEKAFSAGLLPQFEGFMRMAPAGAEPMPCNTRNASCDQEPAGGDCEAGQYHQWAATNK